MKSFILFALLLNTQELPDDPSFLAKIKEGGEMRIFSTHAECVNEKTRRYDEWSIQDGQFFIGCVESNSVVSIPRSVPKPETKSSTPVPNTVEKNPVPRIRELNLKRPAGALQVVK